ncbi:MAG: rubrerythrin family protein [Dehalococcoidia bacterium]
MSKSEEYLKQAFAGESQANRRYLAFAEAADKEGFKQAARLFRAAAEAETIHAISHLKALKAIHSTKENLQEAIGGETHEYTKMYPEMIEGAKAEDNKDALMSFYRANEVEKVHADLYKGLLDGLGKDKEDYPYYVCPVCGYTVGREAPDACPVCGTQKKFFKKVE